MSSNSKDKDGGNGDRDQGVDRTKGVDHMKATRMEAAVRMAVTGMITAADMEPAIVVLPPWTRTSSGR